MTFTSLEKKLFIFISSCILRDIFNIFNILNLIFTRELPRYSEIHKFKLTIIGQNDQNLIWSVQIMNKTFKSFLKDEIKRPLLILPGCLDSEVEFLQYFDHYYDDY